MIAMLYIAVVLLLIIWKKTIQKGYEEKIPEANKALPFIGHIWLGFVKKEQLYNVITEAVLTPSLKKDEEIVCCFLGTWTVYVCLDPEDGYLVANSSLKKDPLYKLFDPLFGGADGLINTDGPTWKVHRKLLNPTMNQSVLDTYLMEFNDHSRQLIRLMEDQLDKGPFDPLPFLKQIVLQSVCGTLMGVNIKDDKTFIDGYSKICDTFTSTFIERGRKFYYHSDFIFNLSSLKKEQDKVFLCLHTITNKVIKAKEAKLRIQDKNIKGTNSPRYKSFLDLLLEMKESGVLTESEIRQEVNTFMGAAFDTTYQTLGTIFLTIGSYPAVQQKIIDELQAVFEGSSRNAERQDLSQLKYLEAAMKETMRLYPPVLGVGRTIDRNLKLKKYTLPAGSRCFVSIYHVGRHRVWGADAEQFRPERWLDGSLPTHAGAYAGFGLGKRSCIGTNFAMMLMKTVLCHVLRTYRISGDVTRLVRMLDVVVTPASGHHISLQRRGSL